MGARDALRAPRLADLVRLDDAQFRKLFSKTSIKRTGRDRFVRNVLIAIGNSGDVNLAVEAERLLDDASPLVRGAAVWALSRLLPREAIRSVGRSNAIRRKNGRALSVIVRHEVQCRSGVTGSLTTSNQNSFTAAISRSMSSGRDSR